MTSVLALHGVNAGYGHFRALFDLSLRVEPGSAVALLGANGAGKTTVARVASGLIEPTDGSVAVDGADLTGQQAYAFARAGVAHAVEGRSVFGSLSVDDNLRLPMQRTRGARALNHDIDEVYEQFPALARRRDQRAGLLSGGEQRMLSIARVLVEAPTVLIADELSLGLAPMIVEEVYKQLARLRAEGTALLIVEQQIAHALDLCDKVLLLEHGSIVWEGPTEDARERVAAHLFEHEGTSGVDGAATAVGSGGTASAAGPGGTAGTAGTDTPGSDSPTAGG